jgi:hypothetical protein
VDRDRIVGYLAALTDDEYRNLSAEARANPTAAPLSPIDQARIEAEQRNAGMAAKARQLSDLATQSDERARGRINLAPTTADRAAAEAEGQAAAAEPQQPQGFSPNRAQGASAEPPPMPETGAEKADRLRQIASQMRGQI